MENNDWTDILYILIAVVFGIIGKLAKKKKAPVPAKKVQPQPEEFVVDESSSPSEEFVGGESASQPKKSKTESIFDTIFEKVFYDDISSPAVEEEEEMVSKEQPIAETRQEPVVKKSGLAELLDKRHQEELKEEAEIDAVDFDLREAVIYSEILNKKYS